MFQFTGLCLRHAVLIAFAVGGFDFFLPVVLLFELAVFALAAVAEDAVGDEDE